MAIHQVGVLGAGTMGNGIAQVFAGHGFRVVLYDIEPAILDRARARIEKQLDRELEKHKITAEAKSESLARIAPTTDRSALSGCDFIVEAASE